MQPPSTYTYGYVSYPTKKCADNGQPRSRYTHRTDSYRVRLHEIQKKLHRPIQKLGFARFWIQRPMPWS